MFEYSQQDFDSKYKNIKNRLTRGVITELMPYAYILGGQPGAGKSLLQKFILSKNSNFIVINADAFRSSHPYFFEIQETYGTNAQDYTQPFINDITEKLIEELSNEHYNLIIEGTLRTTVVPVNTCQRLKAKGYRVELHIISVKKEISYESTVLRYEYALCAGKVARATTKEHHDLVVNTIVDNIDEIYSKKIFDDIQLFKRSSECIYTNKSNSLPSEIENNVLNGSWDDNEKAMLTEIIFEVRNLKKSRGASDYTDYVKRTDSLFQQLNIFDYYIKATQEQSNLLISSNIFFIGNTENPVNIIKINKEDKDRVELLLNQQKKTKK